MKRKPFSLQDKLDDLRAFCQKTVDSSGEGPGRSWIDFYRLILERGTPFLTRSPSDNYPEIKSWRSRRRPKMKQCYYNAQMLVLDFGGAGPRYFEGFAYSRIMPVSHAWVVMPDGNVVDVTLEATEAKFGIEPDETVYLGVPIPFKAICKYIAKYGESGPFAYLHYLKAERRTRSRVIQPLPE